MAFVVSALTDYVDQSSQELLLAAVLGSSTAGLVTAQTGIKSSRALQLLDTAVTFQADACNFSATDSTTYSQRELSVGAVMINEALCPKDLEPKWTQLMLSPGCNYDESDIPQAYMEQKIARIQDALETADWQGDIASGSGNNAFYDGFLVIIDGAAGVVDGNTGSVTVATGIDETNVIAILQGIFASIPTTVIGKSDMAIWIGEDISRFYQLALINANLFHFTAEGAPAKLHGTSITLEVVNGLNGTDRIIAAAKSNMFIGHDLESDAEDFDMFYAKEAKQVRFDVCFKRGTQVAYPAEIVEFTLVP